MEDSEKKECPDCSGTGLVPCDYCRGTGLNPHMNFRPFVMSPISKLLPVLQDCPRCGGKRKIPCPKCKGTKFI